MKKYCYGMLCLIAVMLLAGGCGKKEAEHAEEKADFETERAGLQEQISSLQAEITSILGSAEKENLQVLIKTLYAEKGSLGIFKRKEKHAIQEKIDEASLELKKVLGRIDLDRKEIEKKIAPLKNRVNEINTELSKTR